MRKKKTKPIKINVGWTTAKHLCVANRMRSSHEKCNTPIFDRYKYCSGCGREIERGGKQ